MTKVWEHHKGYRIGRVYTDICIKSLFSGIEVVGKENLDSIAEGSAVMLASNHCCTMMDPLVELTLFKTICYGARSDIFKNPKVAKILRWLRILPLARERNGREEVAKNLETFEEIYECLDNGVPFLMYPEGTHRPQRGMMPVKKGIFRICRDANLKLGKPIYIVPTGLDYEFFFREGGKVRVSFGKPVEIGAYFTSHADCTEAEIYKSLCEEFRQSICSMIGQIPPRSRKNLGIKRILGILLAPIYAICAAAALPIWAISELLLLRMKDKAWKHSVYIGVSLLFPLSIPFHHIMIRLNNFYRTIFNS